VPRDLTPAAIAAMAAGNVAPFYMVAIAFPSGTVYLWTGIGTVTWNGHDWLGVGNFGGVGPITQTNDLTAEGTTLALSGVPAGLVSSAITEAQQNSPVDIWLGFFDTTGGIIVSPVYVFSGHVDVPTIQDSADTVTLSITAENALIALQRASNRRYTQDDQAIDFPDDKGFQYVSVIQQWNNQWGKATGIGGMFATLGLPPD
jgi:hypothetical protein